MTMTRRYLAFILLAPLLAGCAGAPEQRFAVPAAPAGTRIGIPYRSVVLRDVSLPDYAASEEIFSRGADGVLTSSPKRLWADDPVRAMTLELARYMTQITGARVASEPWPFAAPPDAAVEVRVEALVADAGGTLRLSGQYFVATEQGRDRSRLFDLAVRIGGAATPGDIAAARGRIVRDLARDIAAEAAR